MLRACRFLLRNYCSILQALTVQKASESLWPYKFVASRKILPHYAIKPAIYNTLTRNKYKFISSEKRAFSGIDAISTYILVSATWQFSRAYHRKAANLL